MLETTKNLVRPEDLYRLKFLHGAALSPDGKQLVYTVSHTDREQEAEFVTLWLLTLESGETRPLTAGSAKDMFPKWSPDGKQIAFLSTRGMKTQLYLISPNSGDVKPLTDLKQGAASGPIWSPDGTQIAFTAGRIGAVRDPNKPYRVDRPTFRFDGLGYIDEALQDIYVVALDSGATQQITDENCVCTTPRWSPDGTQIMYSVSMLPDTQLNMWPGLRVINVQTKKITIIIGLKGRVSAATWLPDGKHIAYVGLPPHEKMTFATKDELWVVGFDEENGISPSVSRTAGLKYGVTCRLQPDMPVWHLLNSPILITPDGQFAYLNVQVGGSLHIYQAALNGVEQWQPVVEGRRSNILIDANFEQNMLLYAVSTLNMPPELFTFDLTAAHEQKQTAINDAVLSQFIQPTTEDFRYVTPGNVEVEAWLMKPSVGEAPYPTVLYIHGGPYGCFGEIFNFDFQILAGAGFAVLFPNFRGSAGYGTDFSAAIVGNWGDVAYEDNMAAVDYVIAQGLADPDRLGICGYSHGGFATCWTVGHTQRFKAAVPENATTNWISSYGVSDASVTWISDELGGHPHEIPDEYMKKSPILYAHNCTTPTLLIIGERDYRCPAEESEQFYSVLKAQGCTVEMLRLPNSSHIGAVIGPTIVRYALIEALVDWFNRYLA